MTRTTTSRHDPNTIQLAVRVPRTLHQKFFAECAKRGHTGSEMLRTMMERFVHLAAQQNG